MLVLQCRVQSRRWRSAAGLPHSSSLACTCAGHPRRTVCSPNSSIFLPRLGTALQQSRLLRRTVAAAAAADHSANSSAGSGDGSGTYNGVSRGGSRGGGFETSASSASPDDNRPGSGRNNRSRGRGRGAVKEHGSSRQSSYSVRHGTESEAVERGGSKRRRTSTGQYSSPGKVRLCGGGAVYVASLLLTVGG